MENNLISVLLYINIQKASFYETSKNQNHLYSYILNSKSENNYILAL